MQRPLTAQWPGPAVVIVLALALAAAALGSYAVFKATPAHVHEESPAVRYPEVSGRRVLSREVASAIRPAYNFRLTDRTGVPLSREDLAGKVVLLSFVYTNCPEACPLLAGNYLLLQRELSSFIEHGDLALVFITTDPERDTAQVLQNYTESLGGSWHFLTGGLGDLGEVWRRYGVEREVEERNKEVVVYHSYKTHLLDKNGAIRVTYIGVWYPDEVVPDIHGFLH